jgi:hypothetical protein
VEKEIKPSDTTAKGRFKKEACNELKLKHYHKKNNMRLMTEKKKKKI